LGWGSILQCCPCRAQASAWPAVCERCRFLCHVCIFIFLGFGI
jgi:hypothetical protein